jgi:phage shock protein PspC (stress-responsive transcriptional regulator)
MENSEMKKCPYCAEDIKPEAIKCRFCGSTLSTKSFINSDTPWQRVNQGKRIAGVCTGLVKMFNIPVYLLPVRLFFILTTLIYGFGAILYMALWILMETPTDIEGAPAAAPQPSPVHNVQPETEVQGNAVE